MMQKNDVVLDRYTAEQYQQAEHPANQICGYAHTSCIYGGATLGQVFSDMVVVSCKMGI